jgi:hypothetical protein
VHAPGFSTLGWLKLFSGDDIYWFPHEALTELCAELTWLRAIPTRSGTLLVVGESPHHPPSLDRQDALTRGLACAALATFHARHGIDPRAVVEAMMAPALRAQGFVAVPHEDPYTLAFANGPRQLRIVISFWGRRIGVACMLDWGATSHQFGHTQYIENGATPLDEVEWWRERLDELEAWYAGQEAGD